MRRLIVEKSLTLPYLDKNGLLRLIEQCKKDGKLTDMRSELPENEAILDPFLGSGTVQAIQHERCSASTYSSGKKLRDCKLRGVQFLIHRRLIGARRFVSGIGTADDFEIVER